MVQFSLLVDDGQKRESLLTKKRLDIIDDQRCQIEGTYGETKKITKKRGVTTHIASIGLESNYSVCACPFHTIKEKMNVFGDISFYYDGKVLDAKSRRSPFRLELNYVSDYFHRLVVKNKPPKTVRFIIILTLEKGVKEKPVQNGAICTNQIYFNEKKYLNSNKRERYNFLLDCIINCFENCEREFKWHIQPYQDAYKHIKKKEFEFVIESQEKKSPDRKKTGKILIKKDEQETKLFFEISELEKKYEILINSSDNYSWYDPQYQYLKLNKWFSKTKFGVYSKKEGSSMIYDLQNKKVIKKK